MLQLQACSQAVFQNTKMGYASVPIVEMRACKEAFDRVHAPEVAKRLLEGAADLLRFTYLSIKDARYL
jgi:hypothetical protein